LAFLNPLLYPLGGSAAFHDITSGGNGAYHAGVGYDLVTGLGSPNLAALVGSLAPAGAGGGAAQAAPQVEPVA
jgi:kumamolisin